MAFVLSAKIRGKGCHCAGLYGWQTPVRFLFWPCGRRALRRAGADSASTDPKTTTARKFTDVSGRAGAATRLDGISSGPQLAQGHRAGGEDSHKHSRQQESFSHCSFSFSGSIQVSWRSRRAFWLARACAAVDAQKTAVWPFTNVAPGAWASTRYNCMCACS